MSVLWLPTLSPLFVDKLSLTLHVSDDEKKIVLNNFNKVLGEHYGGKIWESTNYNYNKKIYIDGEYILFQCWPKQVGSNWLRLEFTPSKIPPSEVASIVNLILPGGYQELIEYGKVTRIDFAINCKNLSVANLLFYYPGLAISKNHLKSGAIQSAYLGGDESVNQFVFYDKVADIKQNNNKLGKSYKKEVPDCPTTRIEWKYRPKEYITLKCLQSNTSNVFEKLSLSIMTGQPDTPANDKEELVGLVFELSKSFGLQQALFAIRKHHRNEIRDIIIKSSKSNWWKPSDLWKTFPEALKEIISPVFSKYDS